MSDKGDSIPSESKPFNWREPGDDAPFNEETLARWRGRKLSFYDQCCAFAALRSLDGLNRPRWPKMVISKTFGLHPGTVSELNSCLNSMSQRPHYRNVASEFNDLGHDEFMRRYYTEAVHNRLVVARYQMPKYMKK